MINYSRYLDQMRQLGEYDHDAAHAIYEALIHDATHECLEAGAPNSSQASLAELRFAWRLFDNLMENALMAAAVVESANERDIDDRTKFTVANNIVSFVTSTIMSITDHLHGAITEQTVQSN